MIKCFNLAQQSNDYCVWGHFLLFEICEHQGFIAEPSTATVSGFDSLCGLCHCHESSGVQYYNMNLNVFDRIFTIHTEWFSESHYTLFHIQSELGWLNKNLTYEEKQLLKIFLFGIYIRIQNKDCSLSSWILILSTVYMLTDIHIFLIDICIIILIY